MATRLKFWRKLYRRFLDKLDYIGGIEKNASEHCAIMSAMAFPSFNGFYLIFKSLALLDRVK